MGSFFQLLPGTLQELGEPVGQCHGPLVLGHVVVELPFHLFELDLIEADLPADRTTAANSNDC
jgi:hypothetical protein